MDAAGSYHRCYTKDGPCLGAYWQTEFGFNEPRLAGTGCWDWYGCDDDPGRRQTKIFDYCPSRTRRLRARAATGHRCRRLGDGVPKISRLALLDPNTKLPAREVQRHQGLHPREGTGAAARVISGHSRSTCGRFVRRQQHGLVGERQRAGPSFHDLQRRDGGAQRRVLRRREQFDGRFDLPRPRVCRPGRDAMVAERWDRAQDSTANGSFCVYALGGAIEGNCRRYSVTSGAWQLLQVVLDDSTTTHGSARRTAWLGAGTTRVDTVSMHSERSIVQGSFEGGRGDWQAHSGANLATYRDTTVAHDGEGFAATNAPSRRRKLMLNDVAMFGAASDTFVASAWVLAKDVAADGALLCLWRRRHRRGLVSALQASAQGHVATGRGCAEHHNATCLRTSAGGPAPEQTASIPRRCTKNAQSVKDHSNTLAQAGTSTAVRQRHTSRCTTMRMLRTTATPSPRPTPARRRLPLPGLPRARVDDRGSRVRLVRARDVPATGTFCLYGLGTVEGSCQSFTVDASGWQQLQVVLNPIQAHTTLRVSLWIGDRYGPSRSVSVDA